MSSLDYKQFTRRHLPHINPPSSTLFVTYRLVGSIPQALMRHYKAKNEWLEKELLRIRKSAQDYDMPETQEWLKRSERFYREWFVKFEEALDQGRTGPVWMKDDKVAAAVAQSLHELDDQAYTLDAYCVMSNHVHTVFRPFLAEAELQQGFDDGGHLIFKSGHPGPARIMHSLKGRSARKCNLVLGRTGQFWEHESFDHVVRPGKLNKTLRYVLNNPVKAGLVRNWREWRWNYCRRDLYDKL